MCTGDSPPPSTPTPTKKRQVLPGNVRPSHYNLSLFPDLKAFRFGGQVSISLDVHEPTKVITTNAKDLTISKVSLTVFRVLDQDGLGTVSHWSKDPETHRAFQDATSISFNEEEETVSFSFPMEVPAKAKVLLHVTFEGVHNDLMCGFYKSTYVNEEGNKDYLVTTQFEDSSARRCFPCWDEPALKAVFEVNLYVPKGLVGLSNMEVVEERPFRGEGGRMVSFAPSPLMSTYLVAFCVGDLEFLEATAYPSSPAHAKPIRCRTYAVRGKKEMGKFALEYGVRCLEFFSGYFDIAYPLQKMDQVAVPDFAAGAMENWGLCTYRETLLLFDPKTGSAEFMADVADVVAHEISHLWFGDLVSMEWWSDLWLKEGFATFCSALAIDALFPEWNQFDSFVQHYVNEAFVLDGLRSSHPIQVEVIKPSDVAQIFDAISYNKGATVIRMLESFLGKKNFREGLSIYLKRHAYGNATTMDLWNAFAEVSGQDIGAMMSVWTEETGYPMVTVDMEFYDAEKKEMTLFLRQNKFLASGDLTRKEREASPTWYIPVSVKTEDGQVTQHILNSLEGRITFPFTATPTAFWKLNVDMTAFFRVCYSSPQMSKIGSALSRDINLFSVNDRISLISDCFAFTEAGALKTTSLLAFLQNFTKEGNPYVLATIAENFEVLRNTFQLNPEIVKGFNKVARLIFSHQVAEVGYEFAEGEDYLLSMKRTCIIKSCAEADDEGVNKELKERFERKISGDANALNSNLFEATFASILTNTTDPIGDFEEILNIYKTSPDEAERQMALGQLGKVNDVSLARHFLYNIVSDFTVVKTQSTHTALAGIAGSPEKERLKWTWFLEKFDFLVKNLTTANIPIDFMLESSLLGESFGNEILSFQMGAGVEGDQLKARLEDLEECRRSLENVVEKIMGAHSWVVRDQQDLLDWFAKQK